MTQESPIVITLRELRSADRLRIDFTCTNQGRLPLFVYTRVAGMPHQALPHRAYTAYREADEALHLFLGIPPIPKGLRVYAKIVPFATLLRPGQRHADYLDVPIPAPEWQAYYDLPGAGDVETVQARRVVVSTEFFGEPQLIRPAKWDANAGGFRALGAPPRRAAATIELSEPLAVLKRRDAFERF